MNPRDLAGNTGKEEEGEPQRYSWNAEEEEEEEEEDEPQRPSWEHRRRRGR